MLGAWDDQCITLQDINIINETLHTKFMNNTLEDIANSTRFPKLRTYKLFKKRFQIRKLSRLNREHKTRTCACSFQDKLS